MKWKGLLATRVDYTNNGHTVTITVFRKRVPVHTISTTFKYATTDYTGNMIKTAKRQAREMGL